MVKKSKGNERIQRCTDWKEQRILKCNEVQDEEAENAAILNFLGMADSQTECNFASTSFYTDAFQNPDHKSEICPSTSLPPNDGSQILSLGVY